MNEENFEIEELAVSNGEFKTDIGKGIILEGIVNEESNEISRLSLIRKEEQSQKLEKSLDELEDTIASFFLFVAVTNKDKQVTEEQINSFVRDLVILQEDKDILDGEATLNNVSYNVEENERGLVLTATEIKDEEDREDKENKDKAE